MILNIIPLFVVFGTAKKKVSPYIAALILGTVKGVIVGVFARKLGMGIAEGIYFGALAAAFIYFMMRLDRRDNAEREAVPTYNLVAAEKVKFRWEYLVLVVLLVLIAIG